MTRTKDASASVLAIITPLGGGGLADYVPHPDHTLPGPGSAGGEHPDIAPPTDQPHPDQTLPGDLPHPEHPIYYPPDQAEHPIVLPPEGTEPPVEPPTVPEDITERFDVKVGWTAETGWVVVFVPTGPIPTPSA